MRLFSAFKSCHYAYKHSFEAIFFNQILINSNRNTYTYPETMNVIITAILVTLCSFSYAINTVGGGYVQVASTDIKENTDYWSFADFGAQAVVAKARADHKLSDVKEPYKVSTINSLYTQTMSSVNYKYDVKIVNSDKSIVINAKFVVYCQTWPKTRSATIITYDVVKSKNNGNKNYNTRKNNTEKSNGKKL